MLRNFTISPIFTPSILLFEMKRLFRFGKLYLKVELKTMKSLGENLRNFLGETTPNECEANEPNLTNF